MTYNQCYTFASRFFSQDSRLKFKVYSQLACVAAVSFPFPGGEIEQASGQAGGRRNATGVSGWGGGGREGRGGGEKRNRLRFLRSPRRASGTAERFTIHRQRVLKTGTLHVFLPDTKCWRFCGGSVLVEEARTTLTSDQTTPRYLTKVLKESLETKTTFQPGRNISEVPGRGTLLEGLNNFRMDFLEIQLSEPFDGFFKPLIL